MRRWTLLALSLSLLAACGGGAAGPSRPLVAAAVFPLGWAAERVGGDAIEVAILTPAQTEPHDLGLTPGQVRQVAGADLVLYVGADFQPAVEEVASGRDEALDVLEAFDALAAADEHDDHNHGPVDPHVWLDPVRMKAVVEAVGARVAELVPDDTDAIRARAAELAEELNALHRDFEAGLSGCERHEIVVSHEAFGYLADRYGLEQIAISGLDPEAEPSPGRIAEVTRLAREKGATTIFFETLVSPAIAETVAAEAGVETAVLDPLEGPPESGDYLRGMRANLEALRKALGC